MPATFEFSKNRREIGALVLSRRCDDGLHGCSQHWNRLGADERKDSASANFGCAHGRLVGRKAAAHSRSVCV